MLKEERMIIRRNDMSYFMDWKKESKEKRNERFKGEIR